MLHLWDSRHRALLPFVPLQKKIVHFYSCGPTVYNEVHIGNIRSFLFADTLRRWLQYGEKYTVRWVMNITDVDDKTIRDSRLQFPDILPLEALKKFTEKYTLLFFETLQKLNISKTDFFQTPRATDSILEMQALVQKIYNNGFAYEKEGSVYFDVQKYSKFYLYGQLADVHFGEQQKTVRIQADEYEKENASDFVLWKAKKEGEPFWDYEFSISENRTISLPGRPGWHLECSAMEKEAFGIPFDIHSGGVDLCFPHHEDEIAQSTAGYGNDPNVYWVHNEHLFVEGQKMSKSLGNFYTLSDLEKKGFSSDVIRFFLVTNHYRTKLNLSFEALEGAKNTLQKIRNFSRNIKISLVSVLQDGISPKNTHEDSFILSITKAMQDDLQAPIAIASVFEYLSQLSSDVSLLTSSTFQIIQWLESLFGVSFFPLEKNIPEDVLLLVKNREIARAQKQWSESDVIRDMILQKGFIVRDNAQGTDILPMEL